MFFQSIQLTDGKQTVTMVVYYFTIFIWAQFGTTILIEKINGNNFIWINISIGPALFTFKVFDLVSSILNYCCWITF